MDFGYKVIRNRLGSLVANAIQKKIDNNKGAEPFIVVVNANAEGLLSTTINSSKVIQALNENKLVIYKVMAPNGNIACSCNVCTVKTANDTFVQIAFVSSSTTTLQHSGTTIEIPN